MLHVTAHTYISASREDVFDFIGGRHPSKREIRRVVRRRLNGGQGTVDFPAAERWSELERLAVAEQVADVAADLGYDVSLPGHRNGRP